MTQEERDDLKVGDEIKCIKSTGDLMCDFSVGDVAEIFEYDNSQKGGIKDLGIIYDWSDTRVYMRSTDSLKLDEWELVK